MASGCRLPFADEVERLQAAIVLAGGERSPLLEVVFLNVKIPALRKCGRAELRSVLRASSSSG